MMRIGVLVVDGVFDLGLSSVLDTFTLATALSATSAGDGPRFELRLCGVRDTVRTQQGLLVPVSPLPAELDIVVVPASGCTDPQRLSRLLARDDVAEISEHLRTWHGAGVEVAAACTGAYFLAQSGVLDGASATTSWWLYADFRRRFPRVKLDESTMVVAAPGAVTAGAALAHIDLVLWLIRRISPELASTTARYLLCNQRPSQAAYAIMDQTVHDDVVVQRFERWCRANLATFSMPAAARATGTSERTLQRRVVRILGRSPVAYVQDLRVSRAIHRLRTSDATIDQIALEVGYQDGGTLGTLLRRKTGLGLKALRSG